MFLVDEVSTPSPQTTGTVVPPSRRRRGSAFLQVGRAFRLKAFGFRFVGGSHLCSRDGASRLRLGRRRSTALQLERRDGVECAMGGKAPEFWGELRIVLRGDGGLRRLRIVMNSPYSMPVGELSAEVRGSFLVRVYSHLALAILLFVGIEVLIFQSGIADAIVGAFSSVNWLLVLGGFMLLSWLATFLAQPSVSRPLQYLGLVFYVGLQAVITVPLLDLANQSAPGTIASAAQVTLGGFFLLTGVVVVTRKDFSFLRTFLVWGGIFALGTIVCAVLFKFDLGTWFSVAMVLLAGGSILHTTSSVMRDYPENADLAAAIQLFAGVALMFWYVLRLFLGSRR